MRDEPLRRRSYGIEIDNTSRDRLGLAPQLEVDLACLRVAVCDHGEYAVGHDDLAGRVP
jgi:hypothetical protein